MSEEWALGWRFLVVAYIVSFGARLPMDWWLFGLGLDIAAYSLARHFFVVR